MCVEDHQYQEEGDVVDDDVSPSLPAVMHRIKDETGQNSSKCDYEENGGYADHDPVALADLRAWATPPWSARAGNTKPRRRTQKKQNEGAGSDSTENAIMETASSNSYLQDLI